MAIRNLDLISVTHALAVVEYRGFRRAAEAIGVCQSSISKRVARLEDMLGVGLFERYHAGVRVTDAGERFFQHVRAAFDHLDEAIRSAGMSGRVEHGTLGIGILSSLASGFLPELLREFSAQHPDIEISIVECASAEALSLLHARQFDIAFVIGDIAAGDCDSVRFWSERVFLVLPEGHRLGAKETVEWDDIVELTLLFGQAAIDNVIQERLIEPSTARERSLNIRTCPVARDTLVHMVALGQGIGLTSEATIGTPFPGVIFRPFAEPDNVLPFSGVWLLRNNNQVLRRFISLARILSVEWNKCS
ncbi:LysR family transcriptional regulator [Methylovirgula sp. HY1]|uniref:LysR family transcriptional regulator n=1 Tax=Methylovirgula sp. HY1 TaxID=2822761 RepID=UPI001C5BB216|nr:LysR family transcriptional regulator [Methylovirgula sp. HY1]QXX76081.1 HTH-type transcriptional regulator CatM [Methylovirgula sp. HY1]